MNMPPMTMQALADYSQPKQDAYAMVNLSSVVSSDTPISVFASAAMPALNLPPVPTVKVSFPDVRLDAPAWTLAQIRTPPTPKRTRRPRGWRSARSGARRSPRARAHRVFSGRGARPANLGARDDGPPRAGGGGGDGPPASRDDLARDVLFGQLEVAYDKSAASDLAGSPGPGPVRDPCGGPCIAVDAALEWLS